MLCRRTTHQPMYLGHRLCVCMYIHTSFAWKPTFVPTYHVNENSYKVSIWRTWYSTAAAKPAKSRLWIGRKPPPLCATSNKPHILRWQHSFHSPGQMPLVLQCPVLFVLILCTSRSLFFFFLNFIHHQTPRCPHNFSILLSVGCHCAWTRRAQAGTATSSTMETRAQHQRRIHNIRVKKFYDIQCKLFTGYEIITGRKTSI